MCVGFDFLSTGWFMLQFVIKYFAYVLFPSLSLLVSVVLSYACIRIMPRFGLLDHPGGRHVHDKATPSGGGIALAAAFFSAWGILLVSPWAYFPGMLDSHLYLKLLPISAITIIFGLIDDRYGVRARFKLLFQVVIALSCWYLGIRLEKILMIQLNQALSIIFTVGWFVCFMNAFNLIDGMDGVASGLAVMSSLCMAAVLALQHSPLDTVVVLCIGGACLGFLRYNFHPAKLFMGDTGSNFIGFIFAVVGITATSRAASVSAILIPVLAAGVPFFDVLLAVWRRYTIGVLRKLRAVSDDNDSGIMTADTDHLHHRIFNRSGNYRRSTLILYCFSVVFAVVAVAMQLSGDREAGLVLIMLILVIVAVVRRIASVELWNTTMLVSEGLYRPKKGVVAAIIHPFYDLTVLVIALLVAEFLQSEHSLPLIIKDNYPALIYCVFPIIVVLHLGGIYRRCWIRACGREYIYFGELMLLGHIIAATIRYSVLYPNLGTREFILFHGFFFLSSCFVIIAERVGLRILRNSVIRRDIYVHRHGLKNLPRVLIYGGGQRCYFYLCELHRNIDSEPLDVIGILDDHPVLQGQHVYGYKVLGNVEMLELVYGKSQFNKLLIACTVDDPKKLQDIKLFCEYRGIAVAEFRISEVPIAG